MNRLWHLSFLSKISREIFKLFQVSSIDSGFRGGQRPQHISLKNEEKEKNNLCINEV